MSNKTHGSKKIKFAKEVIKYRGQLSDIDCTMFKCKDCIFAPHSCGAYTSRQKVDIAQKYLYNVLTKEDVVADKLKKSSRPSRRYADVIYIVNRDTYNRSTKGASEAIRQFMSEMNAYRITQPGLIKKAIAEAVPRLQVFSYYNLKSIDDKDFHGILRVKVEDISTVKHLAEYCKEVPYSYYITVEVSKDWWKEESKKDLRLATQMVGQMTYAQLENIFNDFE